MINLAISPKESTRVSHFCRKVEAPPLGTSKRRLSIRRSQRPQTQPQSATATASIGQRHLRIAAITPIAYSDCIPHQTPNQSATPQTDPALTQHPRPTAASSLDMPNGILRQQQLCFRMRLTPCCEMAQQLPLGCRRSNNTRSTCQVYT